MMILAALEVIYPVNSTLGAAGSVPHASVNTRSFRCWGIVAGMTSAVAGGTPPIAVTKDAKTLWWSFGGWRGCRFEIP